MSIIWQIGNPQTIFRKFPLHNYKFTIHTTVTYNRAALAGMYKTNT